MSEHCTWTENDDGVWDTECGERFEFTEGTPSDNGMRYCCYCGKRLIDVHAWERPIDDD